MSENNPGQSKPVLADVVSVRQNGLRSINVESDLKSKTVIESYIFTAQAKSCLARIINGLADGTHTRAWTLTGPYGSGKSYFGLFLMNLLSRDQAAHIYTDKLLGKDDPLLSQQISDVIHIDNTRGMLPIPVSGYRASLQECLQHGIKQALNGLREEPDIQAILSEVSNWSAKTQSRMIIQVLQSLTNHVTDLGYRGIFVLFDELGKSMEYSAAHLDQADMYLLQEIAEFANRSGEKPFIFVGILHQAFDRYGALLDGTTQREWTKIQGRFEDIAFQEPPHQQMWLLVNALQADSSVVTEIAPTLQRDAELVAQSGWCPPMMEKDEFIDLCKRAYPLHPTVLAALPYLFRRLAQNERSIFAYLASYEPFGFQQFLKQNHIPNLIRLPDLFDYISANFQARLYASGRTRVITETLERLSNANGLNTLDTDLLKTIGLLNWLGDVSPLYTKRPSLVSALLSSQNSDQMIDDTLLNLQKRSQIVYRRFNQTYAIWQGSDVDIEERLQEAARQISGAFSIAEEVQHYLPPRPIIARRHSFQTGTLRYFEVLYVDVHNRDTIHLHVNNYADGIVLLCLPASSNEYSAFIDWAKSSIFVGQPKVVLGIIERTTRLYDLLRELRSLHWVNQNTPDLRDDPVARRELQTRITAIEALAKNEMERTFSLHRLTTSSSGRWFYTGEEIPIQPHQSLMNLLSNICDKLYSCAPKLWNELLNRHSLSSQGAAARRNLLEGMLKHAETENLGIEGYPPERSMYESFLKTSGIHQKTKDGQWIITNPPKEDPLKLWPLWEAMSDFIFRSPAEPRPIIELFSTLKQPPFGLTDGVLPVFLCAFLLAYQNETTLYREGSLLPDMEIVDWEVLLRRPELFSVAGCRIEGPRVAILKRFAQGFKTQPAAMPVVRALIHNLKSLPEHAWRTQHLPTETLALRKAIETAHSPERLIFRDLPEALGLKPFDEKQVDETQVQLYFDHLNAAFQALAYVTPQLRDQSRDHFLLACGMPDGDYGWQQFLNLANELLPHVTNPTLIPLLRRAIESPDSHVALESVLALIANRPLRNWTDFDSDRFYKQAQYLGKLIQNECKINIPIVDLSPEKRQRSKEVAKDLKRYLEELKEDPQILEEALFLLSQEIRSNNKQI